MADTRLTKIVVIRAFRLCLLAAFFPKKLIKAEAADDRIREGFPQPKPPEEHRAFKVRHALWRSLLVVLSSIAAGYLFGRLLGVVIRSPSEALIRGLQVFGATNLLWATLFVRGWDIQSYGGVTLTERVNRWIYRSLYCLGTAAIVASLGLPGHAGLPLFVPLLRAQRKEVVDMAGLGAWFAKNSVALVALIFSFAAFLKSMQSKKYDLYLSLLKVYDSPEMLEALQTMWDFVEDCNKDQNTIIQKYVDRFGKERDKLHSHRRMVSTFYQELAFLEHHGLLPRRFRRHLPDLDLRLVEYLHPIEEEAIARVFEKRGITPKEPQSVPEGSKPMYALYNRWLKRKRNTQPSK